MNLSIHLSIQSSLLCIDLYLYLYLSLVRISFACSFAFVTANNINPLVIDCLYLLPRSSFFYLVILSNATLSLSLSLSLYATNISLL